MVPSFYSLASLASKDEAQDTEGSAVRKRGRVDDNQREIVKAMRDFGASVWITSNLGDGGPDAVVAVQGNTALVEIKNREGKGVKLTADEQAFRSSWRGRYEVVTSVAEALTVCASLRSA